MTQQRQSSIQDSGARGKAREPRRAVRLTGYGLLDDATTFSISVTDLTYDGCKIETSLALIPGLTLRLSVSGLSRAVPATVRWYKNGCAGLQFTPDKRADKAPKPRVHDRMQLEAQVSLRRQGRHHYVARIFDVTQMGCRVEFVERPKDGELVWIKFDGLDAIEATVRWVDGFYGGLEFVRAIYPAVFDLLLARLKA